MARKVCVDVHTMEKRSDQIRFTTPHRYAVRQIVSQSVFAPATDYARPKSSALIFETKVK